MRYHLGFEGPGRSGPGVRTSMAPQTRGGTAKRPHCTRVSGFYCHQTTPAQLHRHDPKRACAARCRPLVCYQAGRTGPCRTAPSPQAPHTTPHPPRPPVGPFSASTRPDSAAAVRSAPPPCRHVPALPGWLVGRGGCQAAPTGPSRSPPALQVPRATSRTSAAQNDRPGAHTTPDLAAMAAPPPPPACLVHPPIGTLSPTHEPQRPQRAPWQSPRAMCGGVGALERPRARSRWVNGLVSFQEA